MSNITMNAISFSDTLVGINISKSKTDIYRMNIYLHPCSSLSLWQFTDQLINLNLCLIPELGKSYCQRWELLAMMSLYMVCIVLRAVMFPQLLKITFQIDFFELTVDRSDRSKDVYIQDELYNKLLVSRNLDL